MRHQVVNAQLVFGFLAFSLIVAAFSLLFTSPPPGNPPVAPGVGTESVHSLDSYSEKSSDLDLADDARQVIGSESAKSIIEEHWGLPIEEVIPLLDLELELELNGLDLDNLPAIAAWEEAEIFHQVMLRTSTGTGGERTYRRLMSWPPRELALPVQVPLRGYDKLTWEYLALHYSQREPKVDPEAKLIQLDQMLDSRNDELDIAIRQYLYELEKVESHLFAKGAIEKFPLARPLAPPASGKGPSITGSSASARGWKSRLQIPKSDFPYLLELKEKVDGLIEARNHAVAVACSEL